MHLQPKYDYERLKQSLIQVDVVQVSNSVLKKTKRGTEGHIEEQELGKDKCFNRNGKQVPVSTMQKTGWTNFSFCLVTYGLEKGFIDGFDRQGTVDNHFHEYWAFFGIVSNNRTPCCLSTSKCKTSGVPFDDSTALLQ